MVYEYEKKMQIHYNTVWQNKSETNKLDIGPIQELPEDFKILSFKPTETRDMWTYATCGMSMPSDSNPIELHIFAPEQNDNLIELLTVTAHYHRNGASLGLGHTINFGQPWWAQSNCEYGLISLPYLDGPSLEWLTIEDIKIQFLWLIPVTKQEVEYKKKYGLESLEDRFEDMSFNYLNPHRKSIV